MKFIFKNQLPECRIAINYGQGKIVKRVIVQEIGMVWNFWPWNAVFTFSMT
jgi:hypothetical protein